MMGAIKDIRRFNFVASVSVFWINFIFLHHAFLLITGDTDIMLFKPFLSHELYFLSLGFINVGKHEHITSNKHSFELYMSWDISPYIS